MGELITAIRIGLAGLAVHKFRAALSMLGIIFGVASVVAVIAVSDGARGEVLKQLAAMGANNIMVEGIDWRSEGPDARDLKKKTRLRSEGLTEEEAGAAASVCQLIESYASLRRTQAPARLGEIPIAAEVAGVSPTYMEVMGSKLKEGRWLTEQDEHAARRVCVIEEAIQKQYFQAAQAVGASLILEHEPYEVVGVLAGKEVSSGGNVGGGDVASDIARLNRRVYIPLSASLARTTLDPLCDEVTQIVYKCRSAAEVHEAARVLGRFFETAHSMKGVPENERDFRVKVAQDLVRQTEESQRIFNYVMACSAGISLVVGGIGIMNIMLANVTERRREIGIRRAVGATQRDIVFQFLFESLSICLLGGLLGCALGVGFTFAVESMTGWKTAIALWGMAAAMGVSLMDGVLFGTYPAWQAGRLDPIEALRYE